MAFDIIRDIYLCTDCVFAAVNGDMPEDASDQRIREIERGLESLPGLVPEDYENEQAECSRCGWHGDSSGLILLHTDPEYPDWTERACPNCKSTDDFSIRDNGRDEFSWRDCDCCGSTLGGSRTRFAQLIEVPDEQPALI